MTINNNTVSTVNNNNNIAPVVASPIVVRKRTVEEKAAAARRRQREEEQKEIKETLADLRERSEPGKVLLETMRSDLARMGARKGRIYRDWLGGGRQGGNPLPPFFFWHDICKKIFLGTRFAKNKNLFLVVLATWFLPHQIIKGIKV